MFHPIGVQKVVVPCVSSIYSHFIKLTSVITQILYVSKHVTFSVLADEITQIGPQSHIRDCGFLIAPLLNRNPFKEDKPFAVDELITDGEEKAGEARKRKVSLWAVRFQRLSSHDVMDLPL